MNKRDKMLKVAEKLAEQLLTLSGVAQIGLFGSVARDEENPSDVDLFALTEDEDIPLSILKKAERSGSWIYPLSHAKTLNILGAPNILWKVLFRMMWGVNVNIIVMPVKPTSDFLDRFSRANFDEDFLENTARDFQLFDPASGHFQKAEAPWTDYVAEREAEEEWYDDYHDYDYELKATCPECHEAVGWWDEACENCGAQLLPIPPGGFGQNKRPHWGSRQVRTSGGIKPGNVLVRVEGRTHGRSTIVVLTEPRPDELGQRFEYLTTPNRYRDYAYLADCGILPNDDGRWNRTNHLLRTGRRRVDISTLNISG